ncbi:MAG: amino acid ABC transporter permease [Brevinematales bacterium]|jgi:L-cystine transport system permease protein
MSFDFQFVIKSFPAILSGAPIALFIAGTSLFLGLIMGFFIAICRIYKIVPLNGIAAVYVSFIRGVPMIAMLYVVYYTLPAVLSRLDPGISLRHTPSLFYAVVTFTFYMAAYSSETIRSALGSVDKGQLEAAYSVGMTGAQGLWRIIIPQAFVVAIPNLGNTFIGLLKGTSLAYYVGVMEIMGCATAEAGNGFNFLEAYAVAALIYWMLNIVFEKIFIFAENKIKLHLN